MVHVLWQQEVICGASHVLWQQEVIHGASHGACFVAAGSDTWS